MNEKINEMISIAQEALKNSYAPYSNFHVASCIMSENGQIFTGVNVENGAHSMAICAESSAICQMIAAGQQKIKDLVVLASSEQLCPPCGACRQRIQEFSTDETRVYMCNKDGIINVLTINELLPLAFCFNPYSGNI
ncbi:cytidine deaminase [Legionella israelensis]|uniref:Cytidine deaminase n=1 Tax=Legionella israelensis TaxID=454 RepID=A0AAX1EGW1_9GAMM|nr:cytidine deaminase [Legionella israelensis]QBR84225.1 cytidine deaminase [Legionella israelensis]